MYEYCIYNIHTDEERTAYGLNFLDACKRADLNPDDFQIIYRDYMD
jgi:hypothetical protein